MSNKYKILILSALFILSFIIGCQYGNMRSEGSKTADTVFVSDTDTLWKDTVIEKTKFVPKEVIKLRIDTVRDTVLTFEKKKYVDTLTNDNDSIILTSYISGCEANLDSASVDWKKHTQVITNTVTVTKYIEKNKTFWDRFHIGVGVGYGIGLKNQNIEPFLGVSFMYSLIF